MNVKKIQNILKNREKILLEIWQKTFIHIQWLNTALAALSQINILY